MRHFPYHGMPWGPGLGCLLLLALLIALLVTWLVKRQKHGSHHGQHRHGWQPTPPPFGPQPPSAALQILDERLARGDIDVDDYLTRRSALLGDRANGTEFTPGAFSPEHPSAQPTPPSEPTPPSPPSPPSDPSGPSDPAGGGNRTI